MSPLDQNRVERAEQALRESEARNSAMIRAALEEMRAGRGTRYDLRVVDACLRVFGKGYRLDGAGQQTGRDSA